MLLQSPESFEQQRDTVLATPALKLWCRSREFSWPCSLWLMMRINPNLTFKLDLKPVAAQMQQPRCSPDADTDTNMTLDKTQGRTQARSRCHPQALLAQSHADLKMELQIT